MTIGEKIRFLREKKGMTQKELAHDAGCTQPCITKIENGLRPHPRFDTIVGIASALGVSAEFLICTKE